MKVLLVGSGGREHALAWKIRQSPRVETLYCAPGNPGIARIATIVPIEVADVAGLAAFARTHEVDLTVVGPELPLTLGLADALARDGCAVFGPHARAATIESSKVFAKEFMARHGIPTAAFHVFDNVAAARDLLERADHRFPVVVKADGLAAGKGVVVCTSREQALGAVREIMEERVHGEAGGRIVVEEHLEGREVSYFALCDGTRFLPLASCQDYKRALDGDRGPNTGGMGAYSPSAYLDASTARWIEERIVGPTLAGLAAEGREYRGVLYVGLMLTAAGPRVLEYNARFGDPETQALLPRIESDLVPLFLAAAEGRLEGPAIRWREGAAAAIVLAAEGYPGAPRKGMPLSGIDETERMEDVFVFQAGTAAGKGEDPVVAGGRVLAVCGTGPDIAAAVRRAYEGVSKIRFDGMHYRSDIGRDAILAAAGAHGVVPG